MPNLNMISWRFAHGRGNARQSNWAIGLYDKLTSRNAEILTLLKTLLFTCLSVLHPICPTYLGRWIGWLKSKPATGIEQSLAGHFIFCVGLNSCSSRYHFTSAMHRNPWQFSLASGKSPSARLATCSP